MVDIEVGIFVANGGGVDGEAECAWLGAVGQTAVEVDVVAAAPQAVNINFVAVPQAHVIVHLLLDDWTRVDKRGPAQGDIARGVGESALGDIYNV